MIIFKKIALKNFLSYSDFEYEFEKGTKQVQGKNLTHDDQEGNGSGKTAFCQTAIEVAITGTNSRGVDDKNIIEYGYDSGNTTLIAYCSQRDQYLLISRTLNKNKSNKLLIEISSNGVDFKKADYSNTSDGNSFIMNWLDISKDDLFSYFLINKKKFSSFFSSPNADKINLINRFSDASLIDGLDNVDMSDLNKKEIATQKNIDKIDGRIELTKENIETESKRDLDLEFKQDVDELKSKHILLDDEIKNNELNIKSLNREIKVIRDEDILELNEEIVSINNSKKSLEQDVLKIDKSMGLVLLELNEANKIVSSYISTNWKKEREFLKNKIQPIKDDLSSQSNVKLDIKNSLNKIDKKIHSINVILGGSIECPKCSHEFILDGNIDELKENKSTLLELDMKFKSQLDDCLKSIEKLDLEIIELNKGFVEINKKEKESNDEFSELKDKSNSIKQNLLKLKEDKSALDYRILKLDKDLSITNQSIVDVESEINSIELNISKKKLKIKSIKDAKIALDLEIESKKPKDNSKVVQEYENKLSEYIEEKESLLRNLTKIKGEISKKKEWSINFKQFRMYLANQSLEYIQFQMNRYLEIMGSDIRVRLDGYKVLGNGDIRNEINAVFIRDFDRPFGSFSYGEQGRLLFASILANRFMINSVHKYGGLDFLCIDDVFNDVDKLGIKNLIKTSSEMELNCIFVNQYTDEVMDENTILIEYINGISNIKK